MVSISNLPARYFERTPSTPGPTTATAPSLIYTTSFEPNGRPVYQVFKGVPTRYDTQEGPVYGTQWVRGENTYTIPPGAQPVNEFTAPWTQGNPTPNTTNDRSRNTQMGNGDGRSATYVPQQTVPSPAYPAYPFANTPFPPNSYPLPPPAVYPPGHVKAGQPIPQSGPPSPMPGTYPGTPYGAYPAYPTYPTPATPGGLPMSHSPAPGVGGMGPEIPGYTERSVYPPGHVKEGQPMPQSRPPSPNPGLPPWTGYPAYAYPITPAATTPGSQRTPHSPAAGSSGVGSGMPGFGRPNITPLVYPPGHVKEGQPIPYSKPPSPAPFPNSRPPSRPPSGSRSSNARSATHQTSSHPHYPEYGTSYPSTPYSGHENYAGPSRSASDRPPSSSYSQESDRMSHDNYYADLHRQFEGVNLRPGDSPNPSYGYPHSHYSRPPSPGPSRSSLPRSNTPFGGHRGGASTVYPPGHVKAGQPMPHQRTPSPLPNLFGESSFERYPHSPAAPAQGGPPPRMPEPMTVPREPEAQLVAPEGFSRSERVPKMPRVLQDHDVWESDWDRLMQDMAMAWAGKLPTVGPPQLRSQLIKDLVDTWNSLFFFKRGVELVLYQGKRRCSGPHAGHVERDLPDHEDPRDYPSSDSEESSDDEPAYAYTGRASDHNYSTSHAGLRDIFDEGRRRRQAEKQKRREKRKKRGERYREKKYSLYLTYLPE